jgi:putative membrane protein
MLIIAVLLIGELTKATNVKTNIWPLLFFLIPLLMAYTIPPQSFDSNTRTVGDIQLASDKSMDLNNDILQESGQEYGAEENSADTDYNGIAYQDTNNGLDMQNGVITMDSNNFSYCLNEVYCNIDTYEGMPLEIVGFVFKDKEKLKTNEFVAARLMMVCCAADMQTVGFLCQYEKAVELEEESWVVVSGTISKTEFEGEYIPIINVQNVEITEKPQHDYIYPY